MSESSISLGLAKYHDAGCRKCANSHSNTIRNPNRITNDHQRTRPFWISLGVPNRECQIQYGVRDHSDPEPSLAILRRRTGHCQLWAEFGCFTDNAGWKKTDC